MSEHLQSYFNAHPVSRMRGGSQSVVYGTDHLVVKRPRFALGKRFQALAQLAREAQLSPAVLAMIRQALKPGAGEKEKRGLKTLGGLVVPYEIPERLRLRVHGRIFPCLERRQMWDEPVVQARVSDNQSLSAHLREAKVNNNLERLQELLELVLRFHTRLIEVGAYPQDPVPSNYVLGSTRNTLLLRDVGAVNFNQELVRKVLTTITRGNSSLPWVAQMNLSIYLSCLRGVDASPEKLEPVRSDFRRRFALFYTPDGLKGWGRQGGKKVSPLTIPV